MTGSLTVTESDNGRERFPSDCTERGHETAWEKRSLKRSPWLEFKGKVSGSHFPINHSNKIYVLRAGSVPFGSRECIWCCTLSSNISELFKLKLKTYIPVQRTGMLKFKSYQIVMRVDIIAQCLMCIINSTLLIEKFNYSIIPIACNLFRLHNCICIFCSGKQD